VSDESGGTKLIPIGEFAMTDPQKGTKAALPFNRQYQLLVPASERAKIAGAITAAKDGSRQINRMMSEMRDWSEQGGVESILSSSGKGLAKIDNIVRNVQGFVRPFIVDDKGRSSDFYEREDGTKVLASKEPASFLSRVTEFNIPLPEGVQLSAAAARNWNAQIMSLAYATARMAEPSNRGLSDNDIQNALIRLTADGSNPQVIFRRFAEMIGDASIQIDDNIGVWAGHFEEELGENYEAEFRRRVGGPTLQKYDSEVADIFQREGIEIDETGRAVMARPLDVDVQPGEGTGGAQPAEPMSIEELGKALGREGVI
jgi:hypothetical protein